jgi:N-acetylneuraminate synthase
VIIRSTYRPADDNYRNHSIQELQRVIDISKDLRKRFKCDEPVLLVTNVGGFSEHHHLDDQEKRPLRDRLIQEPQQDIDKQ